MLDKPLQRAIAPVSAWVAPRIASVPSGALVLATIAAGAGAFAAIVTHYYLAGLGLLILNRIFAGLFCSTRDNSDKDAGLRRIIQLFDVLLWGSLPFAFALADPARAIAASFLTLSLLVLNSANSLRSSAPQLIEHTELFLAFAVVCVMPQWFGLAAYIFGVLCFLSAGVRIAESFLAFKQQ
jgi:hypothetical protein